MGVDGTATPAARADRRRLCGRRALAAGAVLFGVCLPSASAAANPAASVTTTVFASGTPSTFGPDDVTELRGRIFVAWQDGVGPAGQPSSTGGRYSTLIEYTPSGSVVDHWSILGHIDGLAGDAAAGDVVITVNEDGDSSLYTLTPSLPTGQRLTHYAYNVSPLPHGGGTDAVSVYDGQLLVSASAPTTSAGPAAYRVTLAGQTARVQPVFFDNSQATVADTASPTYGTTIALALTDPDSNSVVPSQARRFGGDFLLDSQGDQQQVYVQWPVGPHPRLSVLSLSQSVDDTAFVTDTSGTLYVTDGSDDEVFTMRGGFTPGTALVAVTPGDANTPLDVPGYLGRLDLGTGNVEPVDTTVRPGGLLFVP